MKEDSLQKVHCHGQTRLVMMVATGPGPQPHFGSKGQGNVGRCGLGQSVRSISGHSAMDFAPVPLKSCGKDAGFLTKSTIMFSPAPWQILSKTPQLTISSGATVACMPQAITRPW